MRRRGGLIAIAAVLIGAGIVTAVWNTWLITLARETLSTPDGAIVFAIEERDGLIRALVQGPQHRRIDRVLARRNPSATSRLPHVPKDTEAKPRIDIDRDSGIVRFEIGSAVLVYDLAAANFVDEHKTTD